MKSTKNNCFAEEAFYGASTLSERGQIVIPAEAREALGFRPGDKLMIMKHPVHMGIVVFRIDAFREFFSDFQSLYNRINELADTDDPSAVTEEKENS